MPTNRYLLLAATLTLAWVPSAHAACQKTSTTKAFSKLGDSADYTLLAGANFESATTDWTLSGASIISGNERFNIGSTSDRRSLAVPASAKVVSAPFCVGVEHPTFRLFARKSSGTWASLAIKLRWKDSRGATNETTVGSLDGGSYSAWQPTPAIKLAPTLPLWQAGQSVTAQIVLDPEDYGGAWQIDDIYIDPYRRT